MNQSGLVAPPYRARSASLLADRALNLYPERVPGRDTVQYLHTPGMTTYATLNAGVGVPRGVFCTAAGAIFVVVADKLFALPSTTAVGTLDSSTGTVCFAENGTQVCVVEQTTGHAYIYNVNTAAFTNITAATNFQLASGVAFLDGYFVFTAYGTGGGVFVSNLYDGLTYSALATQRAESSPDAVQQPLVWNQRLWLFGTRTAELWYDAGNAVFPFVREPGPPVTVGSVSPNGAAATGNAVYWMGLSVDGTAAAWRSTGGAPERISLPVIERAWGDTILAATFATTVGALRTSTYTEAGHTFVVFSVPGQSSTCVYDETENLWHERQSYVSAAYTRWIGYAHAFAVDVHLWIGPTAGVVYQALRSTYVEPGPISILRNRVWTEVGPDAVRLRWNEINATANTGGSPPGALSLLYSDDGGVTFTTVGSTGPDTTTDPLWTAFWYALGTSRGSRVWAVQASTSGPVTLLDGGVRVKPLQT